MQAAAVLLLAVSAGFLPTAPSYGDSVGLSIHDNFESGNLAAWEMPFPEDWEVLKEGSLPYLHMKRSRPPVEPRHPVQFALLKGVNAGNFDLKVKVRRAGGSMIVVFDYVDPLHFYYVHLSENSGTQIAVHNGIFIVDGAARRRIAGMEASAALPDQSWHDVRIVRDASSGSIQVLLEKESSPRFSAIDRTFPRGKIGLGSFDESGDFARFQLDSEDAPRIGARGDAWQELPTHSIR
jgi:hypothetical protein